MMALFLGSQGRVGEVVCLPSILAEHAHSRCCRCPRHAKEQRRAGPRGYRFPQNLPTDVKERSQKMCGSTFFSVSR
ncbi:uncharacterized protein LOC143694270 isoform X2 [Agelaius phoeniceus]|uniref:uncharacterized protein LOC143694270 isoform X2 n=1 Tax=Agelaius phoeniceus TaxID=39638 RepID=UPI004054C53D